VTTEPVTFLAWLAVIAVGSQLIAVFAMWQLQRLTLLDLEIRRERRELTREGRLAQVEEDARVTAEVTCEAVREVQRDTIRDEVRRAFEEAGDRG
jgi:hypothetical protein